MRHSLLNVILVLIAVAAALTAGEMALRLLTPFPVTETSNMREHPLLLYTADPALPEIDRNGFRNAEPLSSSYDLVAIGDSHTFGVNAPPSATWPALVAAATGLSVYNLGMGGYSIYQYDVLFDIAMQLRPAQVVVAIYVANDWNPDCELFALPAWHERAEQLGLNPPCPFGAGLVNDPGKGRRPSARALVLRTALGSATRTLIWQPLRYRWLERSGARNEGATSLVFYEVGGNAFSFALPRLRQQSVSTDLSAAMAGAAYADGIRLLSRWRNVAQAANVRLSVAVVPSKQRVLHDWGVQFGHAIPADVERLTANEIAAAAQLLNDLERLGMTHVDMTPVVVAAFDKTLASGVRMYPPGWDGHPYDVGYAAYAAAIGRMLSADSRTADVIRRPVSSSRASATNRR